MINWKELEKYIAPGKVMTLVIIVDGKEIGALSFNVSTLAYKSNLESVSNVETTPIRVNIADKPTEKKSEPQKKTEPIKKEEKKIKEKKSEPVPGEVTDNDKPLSRDEIMASAAIDPEPMDEPDNVDTDTGEIKKANSSGSIEEEIAHNEHSGSKSAEMIDAGPDQETKKLFGDDDW